MLCHESHNSNKYSKPAATLQSDKDATTLWSTTWTRYVVRIISCTGEVGLGGAISLGKLENQVAPKISLFWTEYLSNS